MANGKKGGWVKWVALGCGGLILSCAGLSTVIAMIVFGSIKSSDVYKESVARAETSSEAKDALGSPVEPGFFVSGSINVNGGGGSADLSIPVHGPKGKGTIYVQAHRDAGHWEYDRMVLDVHGGSQIDLSSGADEESL